MGELSNSFNILFRNVVWQSTVVFLVASMMMCHRGVARAESPAHEIATGEAQGKHDKPAGETAVKQPRQRADTPTGRLLDKLEQQNAGEERYHDPWLLTLKEIVDLGPDAVPELIVELEATDNEMMLRCLGFTMRAIGDRRAVPALIRAIPKTLIPSSSDMGLRSEDAELAEFAQNHELDERSKGNEYGFGRPVREIFGALEKLTGEDFGETEIYHIFLAGTPLQRRLKQELFHRTAQHWADWWEANSKTLVDDADYLRVNLPKLAKAEIPPLDPGAMYKTTDLHSNWVLKSIFDPPAKYPQNFYDLDTGRAARLPDHFRDVEDMQSLTDEIHAWAARNGFDLMATEYVAPHGRRYFALRAIGLRAWELGRERWKMKTEGITLAELQQEATPAGDMLLHYDAQTDSFEPAATASFLYITREGTPGLLFVGIEVRDDTLKPGGIAMGDHELDPVAFNKGRRFAYDSLEEVK